MHLYKVLVKTEKTVDMWKVVGWLVQRYDSPDSNEWGHRALRIEGRIEYEFVFKKISPAMHFMLRWQ